jgi:hypothetical protein
MTRQQTQALADQEGGLLTGRILPGSRGSDTYRDQTT